MIPATAGFLEQDFEIEEQPDRTYRLHIADGEISGFADGAEAVKQSIFRMLNTERYQYVIYPWWYGIETMDLYGEPVTYVCPELERRVCEALAVDTRITGVSDFEFDTGIKGVIHASFVVNTVYGDIKADKEVKV